MAQSLVGAFTTTLAALATVIAPVANAVFNPIGNFDLIIPDRTDFHTWVWMVSACGSDAAPVPACIQVTGIARPNAKAFNYTGDANLVGGRYTLTVDDPFGLRCGNVYYGPTAPTHDVYSWDATTLSGTLVSSFEAGCDGVPGTFTYPIALVRL
ncbi:MULTISPECIES: hypothetical protein [unclassified Mycobacterium]|uniref:hypothetical protein n=1 Tax=unclassified Mycobacterium TaxID=2642494 RepID=UPI0029C781DC|nr:MULTISPECIES: hypothetical protein [unclassified Mycobacterium]